MKFAHIDKSGVVINMIVADSPDHPVPEGLRAVAIDETAVSTKEIMPGPGQIFADGSFHLPAWQMRHLLGHATMRYNDAHFFPVALPDGRIVHMHKNEEAHLDRLVRRAETAIASGVSFDTVWPQHEQASLTLSAADVLALEDGVVDFKEAQRRALAGVQDAVRAGVIKTQYEVDYPPAHLPQWPPRYFDATRPSSRLAPGEARPLA